MIAFAGILVKCVSVCVTLYQIMTNGGQNCLFFAAGGLECRTHFDPGHSSPTAGWVHSN